MILKTPYCLVEDNKEHYYGKAGLLARKTNCGTLNVLWDGYATVIRSFFCMFGTALILVNLSKLHDL